MDNTELVNAVTATRLKSELGFAGSLGGILGLKTNKENAEFYRHILKTLIDMGYKEQDAEIMIEDYVSCKYLF